MELTHEGYEVEVAYNGNDGLELAINGHWDLILLDLMLPGMDGMEICRRIRKAANTPVIMLTARDSMSDKIAGLDMGADDYVIKPFAIEELLARMRALWRRVDSSNGISGEKYKCLIIGDLEINLSTREVKRQGRIIELTKKEFDLLEFLVRNANIVLSREVILDKVWDYGYAGATNLVDVYVRYLRAKVDDPFDKKLIHTVRGVGYIVKE